MTDRRTFLRRAVAATFGAATLPAAQLAASAQSGGGSPYGNIDDGRQPDANDILLPNGFTSRVVARSGEPVGGSGHIWPIYPDGAATFADGDGGWFHAVNSEARNGVEGGVAVIHYGSDAAIIDAFSILSGTYVNCAGGPTPWGTWLSCEEFGEGRVWECDPTQPGQGVVRPALGSFQHEAVAVDPVRQQLYLTEDTGDGRLYRFTPDNYPDLSSGRLEAAIVDNDGATAWGEVTDPTGSGVPTRIQVQGSTPFAGGEGIWYYQDTIYFTSKGDHSVWELNIPGSRLRRIWRGQPGGGSEGVLTHVDNIVVEEGSGDLIVAEDGGNMELVIITPQGQVAPFLRLVSSDHAASEMTGPVFSPDGSRLYFSSQRGPNSSGAGIGVTYEISGPFRGAGSAPAVVPEPTATLEPTTAPVPAEAAAPEPVATPTENGSTENGSTENGPAEAGVTAREAPTDTPERSEQAANTADPAGPTEAAEPVEAPTAAPVAPTVEPDAPTAEPAVEPTQAPVPEETSTEATGQSPGPAATPEPVPSPTATLEGALVINESDDPSGNGTAIALGAGGVAVAGLAAVVALRNRQATQAAPPAPGHTQNDYGWSSAPVMPPELPPDMPTQLSTDLPTEAWPNIDGPPMPPPDDRPDDWPEIT